MKFSYGREEIRNKERAEKYCYLLTNGLGGFSSTSIIGSVTRNDQALLMASIESPTLRYNLVSKLDEKIIINDKEYNLSSQQYVNYIKNQHGEQYLVNFSQEELPKWHYIIDGVEIIKEIVLVNKENTLGISYNIINHLDKKIELEITPLIQFTKKGESLSREQKFSINKELIVSNDISLYINSNADDYYYNENKEYIEGVYFIRDACDDRRCYGDFRKAGTYIYNLSLKDNAQIVFSMNDKKVKVEELIESEKERQENIIKNSNIKSELGKVLVRASDQFIVKRDSIDSLSIIAGYPFFGDWGRDTMYAFEGCCLSTNRYQESKEILRTFIKYIRNGIIPNMFPEGNNDPLYNTVDASLLFIQCIKSYYEYTKDIQFIEEMYPYIEEIVNCYKEGTDFEIAMDSDGLIKAGSGLNQLTWMDVRYKDKLPTPRHGKPVEVNAYWYSSLCIITEFGEILNKDISEFKRLIPIVKKSFIEKFWNEESGCLKDVVSGNEYDKQIRCNQIWAVSVHYSPLDDEKAKKVVDKVFELLYTPYGLRTLEVNDKEFVKEYGGSMEKRDMSYHQGTTWTFPIGSYFRAYLKVNKYSKKSISVVKRQLDLFWDCLREGCVGEIAEIYDGYDPSESKGCFAQAWSVSEVLKIVKEIENV